MYRILLVEDEHTILDGMRIVLSESDLPIECIETAANGWEAMRLIEGNVPDIIVTDIKMPVMDGMELVRYLHNKCRRTTFIIVSGFGDFTYTKQAIRYGVDEYLLKPVDSDELIDSIRRSISKIERVNYIPYWKTAEIVSGLCECLWANDNEAYEVEFSKLAETFVQMDTHIATKVAEDIIHGVKERLSLKLGYSIDVPYEQFGNVEREEYISYLDTYFRTIMSAVSDSRKNFRGNFVSTVSAYMEQNYSSEFSLDDLARHMGFSTAYFSRIFSSHFGQSFTRFRNEFRVNKAQHLLRDTQDSIISIALDTGFGDSTYFVRVFKDITNMTPGEYRRSANK